MVKMRRITPTRLLFTCRFISNNASPPVQPLNVLFFGSDTFSNFSLQALNELRQNNGSSGIVDNIQVVTRSPKWCGRQKSILKYPPIFDMAEKLQLPRPITCDTKQEMLALSKLTPSRQENPENDGSGAPFNAIIAVSFGKLIPGDLIRAVPLALNVHPSLLPRHKGSAPIQRALLEGDTYTGVTIQTLHPDRFDHGAIVAQTEPLAIATMLSKGRVNNSTADFNSEGLPRRTAILMDQLGALGAQLLGQTLRERLYLPQNRVQAPTAYKPSYAHRITTEDKRIHWARDSAAELLNKLETLGPLHAFKEATAARKDAQNSVLKRILFHECKVMRDARLDNGSKPGMFKYDDIKDCILVTCRGNLLLCVSRLQFEGFAVERAGQFMARLRKRCGALSEKLVFL
ncbi:AIS_collapsed_G0001790.mRNA.1.CDS.1 [Saccharomyces cerevisiae]|nr:AIS_collapsed_G0001790.mRNA.1.CDS.1 [Saccharomyces cerevisiae]